MFGTPTRFGNASAQLKQFLDQCGPLWQAGALQDKAVVALTSSSTLHGGQESTLLSLYNVFMHWGMVIVPPGYTHPNQFVAQAPSNPDRSLVVAIDHRGEVGDPWGFASLGSRRTSR